jgi:hypothetical protein
MYTESESMWKQAVVICFKVYPRSFLERLRKTMTDLGVIGVPAEIRTASTGSALVGKETVVISAVLTYLLIPRS